MSRLTLHTVVDVDWPTDSARFLQPMRDTAYGGPARMEVLSDELRAVDPAAAVRALQQTTLEMWPSDGLDA